MTEYDFSPEAYERYLATQARVSSWVSPSMSVYSNPFIPSDHHHHRSSPTYSQTLLQSNMISLEWERYGPYGPRFHSPSSSRPRATRSYTSSPHIPNAPHKLHLTLSSWIKNTNRLSGLIDRLQELASSAPAEHRSQLLRQVAALRATFEKQQEHCMELLQLSEEYANKYLLDISAEIQQQSSFLDKLEERLEAANKLRGEAVDLQMLYESGTVATMENLRATGKATSCRLQRQYFETFNFQQFRGRFQRTVPCSARWT
jgi:hypothetical protein